MDILHLVDRLEELFNNSKPIPLSRNVIVDENAFMNIIDQMRISIPEEIKKAQQIIDRSENEAKKVKEELISEAQRQARLKIEQANNQIDLQRKEMQSSIRKEIVDVALLASERLMHDKIDESFDRQAIESFLKDVDKS